MKLLLFCLAFILILSSCTSKSEFQQTTRCFVKYDSLFRDIDTANLEIMRNTDSAAIEVLDKKSKSGERGLLRFDSNGNLRFYAFLYNDHNDTNFYIEYDSMGNRKRSTTTEVVEWTFFKRKDSILRFQFLLCALDYNFGEIQIEAGKFSQENIELFESDFTKLIGAEIKFNYSALDSGRKIYITGKKQDKCSQAIVDFIDSTIVPKNL